MRCGGGTRKLVVNTTVNKAALLELGKELFFPNGISKKGSVCDFEFEVTEFSEKVIDDEVTIEDLYEATKLPMLRFYLATTRHPVATRSPSTPLD